MATYPQTVTFSWQISAEAARRIYLETGEEGATARSLTFDLITPKERAAALVLQRVGGSYGTSLALPRVDLALIAYHIGRRYQSSAGRELAIELKVWLQPLHATAPVNDEPLTEEQARALLVAMAARYEAVLDEGHAAYDEARATDEAETARREAAAAEKQATEEATRQARVAERATWIAEHGSDFLRRAVEAGYDCQRRYVRERAAVELPLFLVDFDGHAEWSNRSCPSEQALDRALALRAAGLDATVVWLKMDPDHLLSDDTEPREAIVIEGYLGRYTLVAASGLVLEV